MGKPIKTLTLFLFLLQGSALAMEPVSICWETELKPPYLELGKNGKVRGVMVSHLESIFKNANILFEHKLLPWSRCLQGVENGSVDLVPNASYKKERAEFSWYSKPAYTSELMLYYSLTQFPAPPAIPDIATLSKYRVGGIHGFNYSFYKQPMLVNPKVNQRSQLIDMLQRRRIDFAVMQRNVVDELVKRKEFNLRGIGYIPDPVKPRKQYHILVSKKAPQAKQLLRLINTGSETSQSPPTPH